MDPGLCYSEELTKCTDPFMETKIVVLIAPATHTSAVQGVEAGSWSAVRSVVQPWCLMHLD